MVETATEIMFSYLVFIGFIVVFITVTGQNIFGAEFPPNPFTSMVLTFTNTCVEGDWICGALFLGGIILSIILIPFNIISYLWAIFIFFMTSSTLWWVGLILFVPAGIVILLLILPIIIAIIQAIATAIP
jgi:hypothetical protein